MTTEERVKYWIDIADYDLETAEAMYTTLTRLQITTSKLATQRIRRLFRGRLRHKLAAR